MTEFVECQNCGRRFFAENLDCPYCGDAQEVEDLIREVSRGGAAPPAGLFGVLMGVLRLLLVVVLAFELWAGLRTPSASTRALLGVEIVFGLVALAGLQRRGVWGRRAALGFLVANAVLGAVALVWRPGASPWAVGLAPLGLLLLALPLATRPARAWFGG